MSQTPKKIITPWWTLEAPEDRCRALFDLMGSLEQDQTERREKNLQCLRLYGNLDVQGVGPFQYSRTNATGLPDSRVKMNVVCSMIDTVCAKISKMKPRVMFLTSGGDFFLREKSKKLTKWTAGQFQANDVYQLHQQMFRDSCIFDLGAVKHYRDGGRIFSERVLPTEIYVDYQDQLYGKPSHLYHVKYVRKDVLAAQYPKHKAAILESTGVIDKSAYTTAAGTTDDYVVVVEGWRLPSKPGGKDGMHVISVEKAELVREKWKHSWYPFTFERWSNGVVGFYGQSLQDRLTGNQVEINKMLRIIQRSFHLGSAFKVFLEYGSKIAKDSLNNEVGSIVYYNGQAPTYYTPQTVHPEYFRHLEWLVRSSYEEAGISQLSASSKLPAGLDGGSGKAVREYNDLETERFALTAQEYEATHLQTARIYIELAKEAAEEGVDLEAVAESKRFLETIKWSEIAVDDNEYIMQRFPVAQLPSTPAGKLAYVQELIQSGMIDQAWGLSLLEFPDTENYATMKMAPLDDILETFDLMLYKSKYTPPEPFQNLKLGLELGQLIYLRAKKDECPEKNLELVRRWLATAEKMMQKSAAAQQMQQGLPIQADTTAAGGASPVTNTPGAPSALQQATAPMTGA